MSEPFSSHFEAISRPRGVGDDALPSLRAGGDHAARLHDMLTPPGEELLEAHLAILRAVELLHQPERRFEARKASFCTSNEALEAISQLFCMRRMAFSMYFPSKTLQTRV